MNDGLIGSQYTWGGRLYLDLDHPLHRVSTFTPHSGLDTDPS
jgi:hypothetical protein